MIKIKTRFLGVLFFAVFFIVSCSKDDAVVKEEDEIIEELSNTVPVAVITADLLSGNSPLDVILNTSESSDKDGDSLTYSIDYGDGTSGTEAISTHTYTTGEYTVKVTVSDGKGGIDIASLIIIVDEVEQVVEEEPKFVWKNWYLSVPIDRADGTEKATSIYYDAIEADNFTDAENEYFYKNADDSYTFYTKFTGFTTSGGAELDDGKYCRTELREYWKGVQDTDENWFMDDGTHEMESTLQVNYCEGNGQTYVAQIHGKSSTTLSGSPATVKVQWKNGDIVIEYYVKPDNGIWTSSYDEKITIGTVDNEKFTIKLRVLDGKLEYALICEAKEIEQEYITLYDYAGNGYNFDNYFKTGNYFKWNGDYTKDAEVILYSVKTAHN